jgi:hypothetical protein
MRCGAFHNDKLALFQSFDGGNCAIIVPEYLVLFLSSSIFKTFFTTSASFSIPRRTYDQILSYLTSKPLHYFPYWTRLFSASYNKTWKSPYYTKGVIEEMY